MNKEEILENRNHLEKCPYCNGNIKDRKVAIFEELINALYEVYKWCGQKHIYQFEMKQIRHLLGRNEYARFGDLVRFGGGIIYKPGDTNGNSRKALYGMNMERAKEFFAGKRTVIMQGTLNQITNEIIDEKRCYVGEFPKLVAFLDKNGLYDHERIVQQTLI